MTMITMNLRKGRKDTHWRDMVQVEHVEQKMNTCSSHRWGLPGPWLVCVCVCNPFPLGTSQECLRLKEAYASLVSERRAKQTKNSTCNHVRYSGKRRTQTIATQLLQSVCVCVTRSQDDPLLHSCGEGIATSGW